MHKRKTWERLQADFDKNSVSVWKLIGVFKRKYIEGLIPPQQEMNLHVFYQIRYIKYAMNSVDNLRQRIEGKAIPRIITKLQGEIERKEIFIMPFKHFVTIEKRRLKPMLQYLFGKNNVDMFFVRDYKFTTMDYQFFNYLLDTYETDDSRKLRAMIRSTYDNAKRKRAHQLDELDQRFVKCIERGVKDFSYAHPEFQKEFIFSFNILY